jgi:predicted amidohydrolase YtcJ
MDVAGQRRTRRRSRSEAPVTLLLKQVELAESRVVDVRLEGEQVVEIGELRAHPAEQTISGSGCTLLPGLHDHHLHLLAIAALSRSIDVSAGLAPLAQAPGTGWIRGWGCSSDADRHVLDRLVPGRPARVQHRSGALWVLNSKAVLELNFEQVQHPGVERDPEGHPTGRLWRMDAWLSERLPADPPDLVSVGTQLARCGITGVTDATPGLTTTTCATIRQAVPQRVQLLGDPGSAGPVKVVLTDHELPSYPELRDTISELRPRPVAVHCVTREALVLLLDVLADVGHLPGDRIEHGSLIPAELVADMLPTIVTQPGFLLARGEQYLDEVDTRDQADLYRHRSLLAAGASVVASSDAPYGPLDPWTVMRSARDRTTALGRVVNADERVEIAATLDGYLKPLSDLRARARRVATGSAADIVLLRGTLRDQLQDPSAERVVATFIRGQQVT